MTVKDGWLERASPEDKREGAITVLYAVSRAGWPPVESLVQRMRIAPIYDWTPPPPLHGNATKLCQETCSERGSNLGALVFFALRLAKRVAALLPVNRDMFMMRYGQEDDAYFHSDAPPEADILESQGSKAAFTLRFQRPPSTNIVHKLVRRAYGSGDAAWTCQVLLELNGSSQKTTQRITRPPFASDGSPSGINAGAAKEIVELLLPHPQLTATKLTTPESVKSAISPEPLQLTVLFGSTPEGKADSAKRRELLVNFVGYPTSGLGSLRQKVPWYDSPQVPRPGAWNGPLSAEAEQLLPSSASHYAAILSPEGRTWTGSVRQNLRAYAKSLGA